MKAALLGDDLDESWWKPTCLVFFCIFINVGIVIGAIILILWTYKVI